MMREFLSRERRSTSSPAMSVSNTSSISAEYAEVPSDSLNCGWDHAGLQGLSLEATEVERRDSTSSKPKHRP